MPARRPPPWTREELAVLHEFYPREGIDCADRLADRTWTAIHQKAFKLGLRCSKVADAPKPALTGEQLEEAIQLRERKGWGFARIGAKFGVSESAACNAVLIALCPRNGFTPAERDAHGHLTAEGLERVRYALKKGLKGTDIQLRLGVSAGCVAEQRRRYNRELKLRGKAPLPPPGGGTAYSGLKLSRALKGQVEVLFLAGLGTAKISERTGVSKATCTRIRARLVKHLARKGECLPGCDLEGKRHIIAESHSFIPPECREALRQLLLERMPVKRAAKICAIGGVSAYRIRDQLAAELAARGETLPPPINWRGWRARHDPHWPPRSPRQICAFRALLADMSFDQAKAHWRRTQAEQRRAEARRPKTFEEQLARVACGEVGLMQVAARAHLEPTIVPERRSA